jgi:hypothetical protein
MVGQFNQRLWNGEFAKGYVSMARKAKPIGSVAEAAMKAKMLAGGTTAQVAAAGTRAGGSPISTTTAHRWLKKHQGPIRATKHSGLVPVPKPAAKVKAAPPSAPDALLDVPEDPTDLASAPVELVDRWLERVDRAYIAAEEAGNLAAQAALASRATALVEARRKGQPPPAVDPNLNPDLIAAAEACKAKLRKKLADALKGKL